MEQISRSNHVRTEEVLQRVKEERNILHRANRRTANVIGHNLSRNCLLKHVTEGKIQGRIEVTGRRVRRRKQLPADLKETRGCWKFKALYGTLCRTRSRRCYGPALNTDYSMNEYK